MIQEYNPVVSILNVNNWCVFAENCTKVSRLELLGNLFIGYRSYINSGFIRSNVEIGRYCSIGRGSAESIKFKIDNLIDMVLLGCSKIIIPLPN